MSPMGGLAPQLYLIGNVYFVQIASLIRIPLFFQKSHNNAFPKKYFFHTDVLSKK